MKIDVLTDKQVLKYFETRLPTLRKSGCGYMAKCCFHNDKTASMSVNIAKKVWRCHACNIDGGIVDFEKKFSSCDSATAWARIGDVVGLKQLSFSQPQEAIYSYTDAFGKLLFQVVRNPGKRFVQRQPDGKGGWLYKTADLKMVLYNMPKVVTAKNVIVVEGEKDCDNLTAAFGDQYADLAVTTAPRGAGKWSEDLSAYFTGKQVVVLPDNDEPGQAHALAVCKATYEKYSKQVKITNLPGLPEKGDVSDFLKTHPVEDVLKEMRQTDWWTPPIDVNCSSLFMTVTECEEHAPEQIEWLVEPIIQRGSNGIIIARPKTGKSYLVADLAIALASGQKWLGFAIQKPVRVALVSREDNAALTLARIKKLRVERNLTSAQLDGNLYINAKGLKPKIVLDDEAEVAALIRDLKRYQSEFLILDVMRVLHSADENDNTQMQRVITTLNRIQEQSGVSICLIHHDNKREDASLTERARGASAIAGYAEFMIGLRVVDEEQHVREFICELKAATALPRFYWNILDTVNDAIKVERVHWTPPDNSSRLGRQSGSFRRYDEMDG